MLLTESAYIQVHNNQNNNSKHKKKLAYTQSGKAMKRRRQNFNCNSRGRRHGTTTTRRGQVLRATGEWNWQVFTFIIPGLQCLLLPRRRLYLNLQLSFASLSTIYWVYYLVWANELNEALREMTEPYSPRTDDNRFVEQKLERVGMIRWLLNKRVQCFILSLKFNKNLDEIVSSRRGAETVI